MENPRNYAHYQTLEDLRSLGLYKEVLWGQTKVGTGPFVTFGIFDCSPLLVQNGKTGGLSHIFPDNEPDEYLEEILQNIGVLPKDLSAMIIDGFDPKYIRHVCRLKGIIRVKIIPDKRINYSDENTWDVIYLPSIRDVLIYTRDGKNTQKI